ncbi:MAG: hypothetical protein J0L89_08055 [Xanthomonadales bacterium]|nr:hypothetical protein [Xanthomonadales bacterium]MBN8261169.1 hypothetical protein [Xanthomonadales bacterium]
MFYTGSAASFADLKAQIESALSLNGWAVSGGIASKGDLYFQFEADTGSLGLAAGTGASGGALTGACPRTVKMMDFTVSPMAWPATYDIHVLADPDEVYVVLNYSVDKYQHLNFGQSNLPGVGGTGAWFTGSWDENADPESVNNKAFSAASPSGVGLWGEGIVGGFFFSPAGLGGQQASFAHCGLEGTGWATDYGNAPGMLKGHEHLASLIHALPSLANQGTVLLPITPLMVRGSQGQTMVAAFAHARYCRIDNYVPGAVVSYGGDDWKLYPVYCKNTAARNGVSWPIGADHSGTYAVALRYTGT